MLRNILNLLGLKRKQSPLVPAEGMPPTSRGTTETSDKSAQPCSAASSEEMPAWFDPTAARGIPQTSLAGATMQEVIQAALFDPALRQYGRAYAPPPRSNAETPSSEQDLKALQHVLRAIVSAPWSTHLVLRGSAAMRAAIGTSARLPRDLDWVIQPSSLKPYSVVGKRILDELPIVVLASQSDCGYRFDSKYATDQIWAYERCPGTRFAFGWTSEQGLRGAVQVDIAFGEEVFDLPVELDISIDGSTPVNALVAGDLSSLSWKLFWLMTDMSPRGKDLYDAMLLAKLVRQPPLKIVATLIEQYERPSAPINVGIPSPIGGNDLGLGNRPDSDPPIRQRLIDACGNVDWEGFTKEYPAVSMSMEDCRDSLLAALWP